jgi:hypothetical protein
MTAGTEQATVRPQGTFQAMTASRASSATPFTAGMKQKTEIYIWFQNKRQISK